MENANVDSEMRAELRTIIEQGPVPQSDRDFLINGWRWHTKSVLRDISRFSLIIDDTINRLNNKKSKNTNTSNKLQKDRIRDCHNFVMNFNWKALMRVEREIFFPWLQELLPYAAAPLVNDILAQHKKITQLSRDMSELCESLRAEDDVQHVTTTLNSISHILNEAKHCALAIQTAQAKHNKHLST